MWGSWREVIWQHTHVSEAYLILAESDIMFTLEEAFKYDSVSHQTAKDCNVQGALLKFQKQRAFLHCRHLEVFTCHSGHRHCDIREIWNASTSERKGVCVWTLLYSVRADTCVFEWMNVCWGTRRTRGRVYVWQREGEGGKERECLGMRTNHPNHISDLMDSATVSDSVRKQSSNFHRSTKHYETISCTWHLTTLTCYELRACLPSAHSMQKNCTTAWISRGDTEHWVGTSPVLY